MSLNVGTKVGAYEIVELLGKGGMGEVYRARDTNLKREVAIKVLPASVADDPERRARFEREAKAVAALSHPNILAIYDIGEIQIGDQTTGQPRSILYAVTELLEGETLRERLAARVAQSAAAKCAIWSACAFTKAGRAVARAM